MKKVIVQILIICEIRKIILVIFLINCCIFNLLGQNLSKLDINNGFRKYKFGMSPKQMANIKKEDYSPKRQNVDVYSYTRNDIDMVYGVKIDRISLSFFKNKLFSIQVVLGSIYVKYEDQEYAMIQDALESNFGTRKYICGSNDPNILNCHIWDAKIIRCEHVRLHQSEKDGSRNPDFNYIAGYILFTHKPFDIAQKTSEF